MPATKCNGAPVELKVLIIDPVLVRCVVWFEIFPEHRFPVVRIVRTPHAGFIAVIDHGGADVRHLQQCEKACSAVTQV